VSNGNEKFLSDIRNAIGALTEADPYYSDIPVITERLKDIQGRIDLLVGRAGGLALLLVTPVVGGVLPNVQGANFTGIMVVGRVLENTKINATGKEALDVAIYTAALWSQLKPDALSAALRPNEPTIVLGNDPKFLSYDINFLTEGGTKISIPTLAGLTIDAGNLAAIVLAQTTPAPGAAIFYTLDGTAAAPRNPAAHLYLAPFNAASGTTVRARAWLPGSIPSAELRQIL
jgi:Chitobiase/beta-hexosaminidase C-terminal domain